MNWLDSHCHINDEAFNDDLDSILQNMVNNDVTKAMIVSLTLDEYKKAKAINHPSISFKRSLGVYPEDAKKVDDELFLKYVEEFKKDECDAIGEIGLDYHWSKDDKDIQIEMFKKQLLLAQDLNKPVIVHSRDAIQDTFDLMKQIKVNGVMHCYSNSAEMAKEFVKLGYYISISGTVTFKNAKEALKVIEVVPLDNMLIETDCPYLTPVPYRGERNEPAYVVETGKFICNKLNIDEEVFKNKINENYERLFSR